MYEFFKRLFDLIISGVFLIALSPLMILIFSLIKLNSPKESAIYKGERGAINNDIFYLYKFRTMRSNSSEGERLGLTTSLNDERVTNIGLYLRKYKLDELPQLYNVFKGEMSLVGPRPQFKYYTNQYSKENQIIMSVKPGITDLASLVYIELAEIVGSQDADYIYEKEIEPNKNALRVKYVHDRNFLLDIKILLETFFRLIGFKDLINLDLTVE